MGSHNQTADMKTFLVLLLVACVLVQARSRGRKGGKGRDGSQEKPIKQGRHHDKGERVWHVAASQEECGDGNTTFHQSHEKPHDLCTEVNATISVCTTRDTEVLESMEDDAEDEAEPRHDDDEDHDHDVYVPKEDAEWDFKTGTCVFKLSLDGDEEDSGKDKKRSKNKKPTKAEKKRQQDRSKMRRKLKQKDDTKGRSNKHKKNKKHGGAQPRTNSN